MVHSLAIAKPQLVRRLPIFAALGVLVVGLAITFFVGRAELRHTQFEDQQQFENLTDQLQAELQRRIIVYRYGMMGTRSVFAASSYVDHEEFLTLVESRELEAEFPGALGIGYIERIKDDQQAVEGFARYMREEGVEGFTVSLPPGSSPLESSQVDGRFIVKYIEPIAVNASALGLDIGAHELRRKAAERAALEGDARLTAVIRLVQDEEQVPGFLYLLPDYTPNLPLTTPEQRVEALRGWVYMPVLAPKVFEGITDITNSELQLEAFCNDDVGKQTLLYRGCHHAAQADDHHHEARHPLEAKLQTSRTVSIGGRTWTLNIQSTPKFEHVSHAGFWIDIVTGVLLSLVLAILAYSQGSAARRAVGIAKGMTADLREYAEHAQQATKAKSDFLANMSHEIRTPMTAILGFTDLLRAQIDQDNEEAQTHIKTIKRNGDHLLSLINDILDMSKIEAGKLQVEQIAVAPDRVVCEVLSLMRVKADEKKLPLSAEITTPIPHEVIGDPVRLRQILVNLVGNAIKFTEQGEIAIKVRYDESMEELKFDIIDSGVGMTEDQVGKLFGAFQQADTTTTRQFGGTGLGLHISQRLATLLGGNITCDSTYGQGSTFTVTIYTGTVDTASMIPPGPIEDRRKEEHDEPAQAKQADDTPPLTGINILLAEDGKDNQRLINHHLTKAGATVTIVENGKLAVEALCVDGDVTGPLLSDPPFDLVITDMQMPEMDGYTEASLLREKGCLLPIIALTAHAMKEDVQKCLDAGCDFYASKPVNKKVLIETCVEAYAMRNASKHERVSKASANAA